MKDGFTVLQTLATLDPGHYLVAQVQSNQKGEQTPDLASASDISSNTGGMVGAARAFAIVSSVQPSRMTLAIWLINCNVHWD